MMDADGPSRARNVPAPFHVEPITAEQLGVGPIPIDVEALSRLPNYRVGSELDEFSKSAEETLADYEAQLDRSVSRLEAETLSTEQRYHKLAGQSRQRGLFAAKDLLTENHLTLASGREIVIPITLSQDKSAPYTIDRSANSRLGDPPGAYVASTREKLANPASGTSHYATEELKTKYSGTIRSLVERGVGSTAFGDGRADQFFNNDFQIGRYPEEFGMRKNDPTYHKYGVLTYVGPVDDGKGITLEFVEKDVIVDRYSFPTKGVAPVRANFTGKSDVYAVAPWNVVGRDSAIERTLADPSNYTYNIGVIEQVKVPNGVVNMTTENHNVYPGTIRRTAMEVDGHLFIYTSGAGINRMNNSGDGPGPLFIPVLGPAITAGRGMAQRTAASGNDQFGPMAFRTLDQQAVKFIQERRK